jgi:hypothetical protein
MVNDEIIFRQLVLLVVHRSGTIDGMSTINYLLKPSLPTKFYSPFSVLSNGHKESFSCVKTSGRVRSASAWAKTKIV